MSRTPNRFPDFIDLKALAFELAENQEYRRVRSAIDKASRAQSCEADLDQAGHCCAILGGIRAQPEWDDTLARGTLEASLLLHAVVLYERATAAAAKLGQRGSIGIRDWLNEDQRIDHDAIVAVRNRALAHVYVDEKIDGLAWHSGSLLGLETAGAFRPMYVSQRIHFHPATFDRLLRQVPVAQRLIQERFQVHADRLADELNRTPLPREIFRKYLIDPVALLGSEKAVEVALAGQDDGRASFVR